MNAIRLIKASVLALVIGVCLAHIYDAHSAPFLQADAIPATAVQPDSYVCTFGTLTRTFLPVKNTANNTIQLNQDLATVLPVGVYQGVTCLARKVAFPDSPKSNTVDVSIGVLTAPVIIIILQ
jgi:hypothetical protein